jgi:hypothetical protein
MLIAWTWIAGDKTIVPTSMSGSYYTSARNLFVGSPGTRQSRSCGLK